MSNFGKVIHVFDHLDTSEDMNANKCLEKMIAEVSCKIAEVSLLSISGCVPIDSYYTWCSYETCCFLLSWSNFTQ